ncbi:MAG: gamma-glutamyltransferase [Rhodospirillales bacterium]|nr:gamma-glutamyltransferase [Rhodospirillales bacterium]
MASLQPNYLSGWRQFIVGVVALGLSGCGLLDDEATAIPQGTIGYVQGNLGGVASDEPRSALIGREILAAGGSAADAAVATFFALTVTLPSAVSLGGGGVCLVRDHQTDTVETLDFRAMAALSAGNNADVAAIPGSPRGIFALHAKHGKLKWAELVRPAENLARFGTEVSCALGQDLKVAADVILANNEMRDIFSDAAGTDPYNEGAFIKQTNLSTTLARIRSRGASDLYTGLTGRQFADQAQSSGPAFTYEELRDYLPQWRATIEIPFIKSTAFHFPSLPGLAGATAAQITAMLVFDDQYEDMNAVERAHLLAEAIERSLADRPRWQNDSGAQAQVIDAAITERLLANFDESTHNATPSAVSAPTDSLAKSRGASFSIVDQNGSAVACSFTMNKPFGVGRMASGTGVVLAAPPATSNGDEALASVMMVSKLVNKLYYVSSASGGAAAPSALVNVLAGGIIDQVETLENAMQRKRVHHGGADGITYLEKGIDPAIVNGLGSRGHKMAYVRILGYVNALFCATGIPSKNGASCVVRTDPRGFGLGVGSE